MPTSSDPDPLISFAPVRDAWFLTGPTASGKSRVGMELARRLDAEIVSLDSMAIYRGMDIGTAKPLLADRRGVPHHLLDFVQPDVDYSISEYVRSAHEVIRDIRSRSKEVLFVGGSPLYLKAMLRGLYPGPPADWDFRRQIEEETKIHGLEALHQRLELVDPITAARLHHHDKRRIIRALEVYRVTGRPISHLQIQFDDATPAEKCKVFVLSRIRADLHARIDARVEGMFVNGLVQEVRQLVASTNTLSRTALQAVGYREVIEHLRGERDLEATIELVKSRTRQFARRQDTWFRSLCECRPVPQDALSDAAETASQIVELGKASPLR